LWISPLFCAAIEGIAGSIGTGLLANNIDRYQIGSSKDPVLPVRLVAVRKDSDRVLPSRAGDLGGLAVALIHFNDRHRLPLPERDQ
jgi:hypothetical protein